MNILDKNATYKLFANALTPRGYSLDFDSNYPATATYTSPHGMVWKTRAAHITYPMNTRKVYEAALRKDLSYEIAAEAGLEIPKTVSYNEQMSDKDLDKLLQDWGTVVVKPTNLFQSKGVTVGLQTLSALKQALRDAQAFSSHVLIQQQVEGEEIRFTVINREVEAALLRRTARVEGDGISSLADLIRRENKQRRTLHFKYLSYPLLDETLVDPELLGSDHVPAKGEVVELNRSTLIRGGCSVYNILSEVDASYVKLAKKAAEQLGAGVAVVDIFCHDYKQPASRGNYWFNEFNTAPSVRLYYSCRDGKQYDIVERLADAIDSYLHTA